MSMAERELRRLQQALQDALAKGAPDILTLALDADYGID